MKTSYAYAEARIGGNDPLYAAANRWKSNKFPADDAHPPHERAWGRGAPLNRLLEPLRPGEDSAGEDNRLGAYAARLWLPILHAEQRAQ